jgi:hypothetical protein
MSAFPLTRATLKGLAVKPAYTISAENVSQADALHKRINGIIHTILTEAASGKTSHTFTIVDQKRVVDIEAALKSSFPDSTVTSVPKGNTTSITVEWK